MLTKVTLWIGGNGNNVVFTRDKDRVYRPSHASWIRLKECINELIRKGWGTRLEGDSWKVIRVYPALAKTEG